MKKISRYIKIELLFIKYSFIHLMSHRFNLIMSAVANIVWTLGQLFSLNFLFTKIPNFAGWSIYDMILLLSTSQFLWYTSVIFFDNNIEKLPQKIIKGELDSILLKPISPRFFLSFERTSVAQIVPMITTVFPLFIYAISGGVTLSVGGIIGYLVLLFNGFLILYFIAFTLSALAFFFEGAESLRDIFYNTLDIWRIPMAVLPGGLQFIYTFLIPIAFMTFYPVEMLKGSVTDLSPIALSIFFVIITFIVSQLIWRIGIRKYSGAS